jgi:hypothetical protein
MGILVPSAEDWRGLQEKRLQASSFVEPLFQRIVVGLVDDGANDVVEVVSSSCY